MGFPDWHQPLQKKWINYGLKIGFEWIMGSKHTLWAYQNALLVRHMSSMKHPFFEGDGGARENFKVVRVWRKIKWRQNRANYKKREEHEGLQAHYTAMQSSRWGLDTGVL